MNDYHGNELQAMGRGAVAREGCVKKHFVSKP